MGFFKDIGKALGLDGDDYRRVRKLRNDLSRQLRKELPALRKALREMAFSELLQLRDEIHTAIVDASTKPS